MPEPKPPNSPNSPKSPNSPNPIAPWHVPVAVEDIAESGDHFNLVADATVRAAVAKVAGLRDLPRFEANFDVVRRGLGGLHVAGTISATVGQACVVTLEPLANEVEESIDLVFEPQTMVEPAGSERQRHSLDLESPEPLVGGVVDLGALATEFLILGIDPYPRKPVAVFEAPPQAKGEKGPFAALEPLAKRQEGS